MTPLRFFLLLALCGPVGVVGCANQVTQQETAGEAELRSLYDQRIQFYQDQGYTYRQAVMMADTDLEKLKLRQKLTAVLEDAKAGRPSSYHGEGSSGIRYWKRYNR